MDGHLRAGVVLVPQREGGTAAVLDLGHSSCGIVRVGGPQEEAVGGVVLGKLVEAVAAIVGGIHAEEAQTV